ncbi:hypothetical protein PLESTM_000068900 [Pleodorina starrii]|nr:hypothetical protein PLESTM_000068900 [Pleodorina starrii]
MDFRPRPSSGRAPEIGGGTADERAALLGPAAHNLRQSAAAHDNGSPASLPAAAALLAGRSAWAPRVTSSPGLLLPGGAPPQEPLPQPARRSPLPPQQQQQLPASFPSPVAYTPLPPAPDLIPAGPSTAKRRYLCGSGGAAAHHQSPPHSPSAPPRAASASAASPHSRAYTSFLAMRRRTVFLINLVSIMERMDEQIVPALSRPLGCAFGAGPHQLGLITFARALVQAVSSPLGGLAGHYFDRVTVLFLGCAIWGFFCTAFSFATTVNQGILAWAFNGVGLSLIIPNSQSLVADYYTATQRGEAFGTLMLTGALGGMLGAMFATNLGGLNPLGMAGWRLAFVTVGAVSLAIGAFTLLLAVDPTRHTHPAARPTSASTSTRRRPHRAANNSNRHHRHRNNDRNLPATTTTTTTTTTAEAVHTGAGLGATASKAGPAPAAPSHPDHVCIGGQLEEQQEEQGGPFLGTGGSSGLEEGGEGGSHPRQDDHDHDHQDEEHHSDWSGFEGQQQQLLFRHPKISDDGGGDGGGAAAGGRGGGGEAVVLGRSVEGPPSGTPSPPASPAADTPSGEPNPRRPLLRRCAPAAHSTRQYEQEVQYGTGGGHPRYSYGYGTTAECTTTARSRSTPVPVPRKVSGGSGDGGGGGGVGEVVVAGCAVEGGGYESAAATAAVVLGSSREGGGRPVLTWRRIWDMITTPTFLIIILQGIVGSTPWNALVFLTLYLQLIGFSDVTSSALMALFLGGTAAGALVGGWLGDRVAERHPHHGRVALVQFSVGIGVPLCFVIMWGLPMAATPATAVMYGAALLLKGVLTSWAAPACNNPVFAEIVPPDMRNLVYAFDRSFEGAISALGAPLVGMAAERWFGFTGVAGGEAACEHHNTMEAPEADLPKARALGDAMLLFMAVPWTLCALFYTGLHWSYPRDRARALRPQVIDVMEGPGGSGGRRGAGVGGLSYKSPYGAGGAERGSKADV